MEENGNDGASIPPPPPTNAGESADSNSGRTVAGVLLGLVIGIVLPLFLAIPTMLLSPNIWVVLLVILAALLIALVLMNRAIKSRWLVPTGLATFAAVIGLFVMTPIGNEPMNAKPTPWAGASWDGTDVEYWDLSTGSRIGYVKFAATQPIGEPPIMFLHGGPGGGVVPQDGDFARRLNDEGFDVYLYDQAGVGWSTLLEPEEYTIDRMVADLEAIRLEIGSETLNLVGHSWGGSLAAHYTVAHDDNVEHVWLSNPGEYGGTFEKRSSAEEPDLTAATSSSLFLGTPHYRLLLALGLGNLGADPDVMEVMASQEQLIRYAPDYADIANTFNDGRCEGDPFTAEELEFAPRTNFNFYANLELNDEVAEHDPTDELDTISSPMVIGRGVCDYIPWDAQKVYRDEVPGAELVVIPEVGHAMRPSTEIAAFFRDGDPGLDPYTSDDVPSPG